MTSENLPQQLLAKLKLPRQDRAELSFCGGNRPAAVKTWAQSLPATRVNHTSVQLYKALPEICQLNTSADNRLEMLEAIRPYTQQCIQGLAKHFLNQPLILPEAPLKTAIIAQALQRHMTIGYSAVISELAGKVKKGKAPDAKLGVACHRALTGFGLLLLRGYQLYSRIPSNLWLELHSLYRFAEHYELLDQSVEDTLLQHSRSCTITQAYTRILLLACARPNQMRQTDVSAAYDVLENWAHLARIQAVNQQKSDNLFLINLSADMPPLYKSRFAGSSNDVIRELDA
ncbi:MAG: PilZ domain-containing protein, partial [Cellvibrionaceae bacterium]